MIAEDVRIEPDARSQRVRNHDDWEPDWVTGVFVGQLRCSFPSCDSRVTILGDGSFVPTSRGRDWDGNYEQFLVLRVARPALPLIELPTACPEPVCNAVQGAADVVWLDASAAVNRMRVALEVLMDAHGIARNMLDKRRKRVRLSLHARLERFQRKKSAASDFLMAVKWLGNDASHQDVLELPDAFEAAELLEHALELVYDDRASALKRRAVRIVTQKGAGRR